jgi:hypothetical protein
MIKSAIQKLDGVGGVLPSGDELKDHGESIAMTKDTFTPPFAARAFNMGARRALPADVVEKMYRDLTQQGPIPQSLRNMGGRDE